MNTNKDDRFTAHVFQALHRRMINSTLYKRVFEAGRYLSPVDAMTILAPAFQVTSFFRVSVLDPLVAVWAKWVQGTGTCIPGETGCQQCLAPVGAGEVSLVITLLQDTQLKLLCRLNVTCAVTCNLGFGVFGSLILTNSVFLNICICGSMGDDDCAFMCERCCVSVS